MVNVNTMSLLFVVMNTQLNTDCFCVYFRVCSASLLTMSLTDLPGLHLCSHSVPVSVDSLYPPPITDHSPSPPPPPAACCHPCAPSMRRTASWASSPAWCRACWGTCSRPCWSPPSLTSSTTTWWKIRSSRPTRDPPWPYVFPPPPYAKASTGLCR